MWLFLYFSILELSLFCAGLFILPVSFLVWTVYILFVSDIVFVLLNILLVSMLHCTFVCPPWEHFFELICFCHSCVSRVVHLSPPVLLHLLRLVKHHKRDLNVRRQGQEAGMYKLRNYVSQRRPLYEYVHWISFHIIFFYRKGYIPIFWSHWKVCHH